MYKNQEWKPLFHVIWKWFHNNYWWTWFELNRNHSSTPNHKEHLGLYFILQLKIILLIGYGLTLGNYNYTYGALC